MTFYLNTMDTQTHARTHSRPHSWTTFSCAMSTSLQHMSYIETMPFGRYFLVLELNKHIIVIIIYIYAVCLVVRDIKTSWPSRNIHTFGERKNEREFGRSSEAPRQTHSKVSCSICHCIMTNP